jgi:hypothetical protein
MNVKKVLLLATIFLAIVAVPLYAAHATSKPANTNIWDPSILKGPLVLCTGSPIDANGNTNPSACSDLCDLIATIINIVYFGIGAVLWIVVPISFAIGGFFYLISGASPEMLGKAKKTMLGAVIGLFIVLCSWLILNTFITVLGIAGVGGFGTSSCTVQAPPPAPPPASP